MSKKYRIRLLIRLMGMRVILENVLHFRHKNESNETKRNETILRYVCICIMSRKKHLEPDDLPRKTKTI